MSVRPSVRHKPVLYQNEQTDRAGLCPRNFLWRISQTVLLYRNSGTSKNKGTSLWNFVPNSGQKISPRVGAVVNKTCRRSNVWIRPAPTTVERVVAVCVSLLYAGRLQPSNSITSTCSGCTSCSYTRAAVSEILTATSRRAVRLRQQSFL